MCGNSSIPAGDFSGVIRDVTRITDRVISLGIECPVISRIARPGQFVTVRFPDRSDLLLGRPFAVSSVEEDRFFICFQVVGKMTELLSRSHPGTELSVRGPMGNGFGHPSSKKVTMIAGSLGVAPLLFAWSAISPQVETRFILGVSDHTWIPFCNWVRTVVPETIFVSEDGSIGKKGNVLAVMDAEPGPDEQIWACGPLPMLKAIGSHYPGAVHRIRVSLETRMACGMGGCHGCVINTTYGKRRVCVDGPVFTAGEVCWDDLKG